MVPAPGLGFSTPSISHNPWVMWVMGLRGMGALLKAGLASVWRGVWVAVSPISNPNSSAPFGNTFLLTDG